MISLIRLLVFQKLYIESYRPELYICTIINNYEGIQAVGWTIIWV